MPVEPNEFRAVLGCFASGVTIVTTVDATGTPYGLTVSSFSSVSLTPPLILFCIAHSSASRPALLETRAFAIHVLSHGQENLSCRFASRSDSKWHGVDYELGRLGTPLLRGCLAALECRIAAVHTAGDHDIVVGAVHHCLRGDGKPLVYHSGSYRQLSVVR